MYSKVKGIALQLPSYSKCLKIWRLQNLCFNMIIILCYKIILFPNISKLLQTLFFRCNIMTRTQLLKRRKSNQNGAEGGTAQPKLTSTSRRLEEEGIESQNSTFCPCSFSLEGTQWSWINLNQGDDPLFKNETLSVASVLPILKPWYIYVHDSSPCRSSLVGLIPMI